MTDEQVATKSESPWGICGHEKIVDFLQLAVKNQSPAQAYFFFGPNGVGKNLMASKFIAALLCTDNHHKPCGQCVHCRQLHNGVHPDVQIVERLVDEKTGRRKKDLTVEQIRDLKSRLQQGTLLNSYKIAIIREAQHLNANAANALLKLLEEPTSKTVIILISDYSRKPPATILSRCQTLKFLPVATSKIKHCLLASQVPAELATTLAHWSMGRPGIAWNYFFNEAARTENYHYAEIFFKLIGQVIHQRLRTVEEELFADDENGVVENIIGAWQQLVRDALLLGSDNEFLVSRIDKLTALKQLTARYSGQRLADLAERLENLKRDLRQQVNPKAILENFVINL